MNNIIITSGLVIPEGAKVLIVFGGVEHSTEEVTEMRETLNERFPGREFTFVYGATGVAIMDADMEKIIDTNQKPVPLQMDEPQFDVVERPSIPYYGTREDDLGVEDIAGRTPLGGV